MYAAAACPSPEVCRCLWLWPSHQWAVLHRLDWSVWVPHMIGKLCSHAALVELHATPVMQQLRMQTIARACRTAVQHDHPCGGATKLAAPLVAANTRPRPAGMCHWALQPGSAPVASTMCTS